MWLAAEYWAGTGNADGISALQYQSISLACAAHETWLPDNTRTGFFLGDGEAYLDTLFSVHEPSMLRAAFCGSHLLGATFTNCRASSAGISMVWTSVEGAFARNTGPGVGKGRQIAALIFENFCRGRTKVRRGVHCGHRLAPLAQLSKKQCLPQCNAVAAATACIGQQLVC